jgi:chemotaxis protein MotB
MAGKGGAGKGAAKQAGVGQRNPRPKIIIRKEEIIEGAHHGGAWKVAYADFVTAMMAFFLLMWLINATTEDQRRGIAAYFSPMAKVENGFSASGMVPGGAAPVGDGAQLVDQGPAQLATLAAHADSSKTENDGDPDTGITDAVQPGPTGAPAGAGIAAAGQITPALAPQAAFAAAHPGSPAPDAGRNDAQSRAAAAAAAEEKSLHEAARHLRDAVARDPALASVAGQMAIDVTPEGLRIQIMDAEHRPMFDTGSTAPTARARALLRTAAHFIIGLPEPVSIGGHTDAAPYRTGQQSNWSLSSERADAARDVLVAAGLPDARLSNVTGYADRKLLLPADPLSPANRRIVLTLQRVWPQARASGTR